MVKTWVLNSKVSHLKRLEVTGQGEIVAIQDFDWVCRLPYGNYACDTPLSYHFNGNLMVSNNII